METEWMVTLTVFMGIVTPFVVNLLRKISAGNSGVPFGGWKAQLIALGVSGAMGVLVGVISGELVWGGDLVASGAVVYAIASMAYEIIKSKWEEAFV